MKTAPNCGREHSNTYIQYPNCILGCGNQRILSMAKVDKSTCWRFHFGYASFYYILDEIEQWLCSLRRWKS